MFWLFFVIFRGNGPDQLWTTYERFKASYSNWCHCILIGPSVNTLCQIWKTTSSPQSPVRKSCEQLPHENLKCNRKWNWSLCIWRLWLKYGACLCLVLSGDLSRHSFSPVFHGKRLHHVFNVGNRVHCYPGFASRVFVRIEMDFALAKKELSTWHRAGYWGSKRNWKTDCSSFSSQRFV